ATASRSGSVPGRRRASATGSDRSLVSTCSRASASGWASSHRDTASSSGSGSRPWSKASRTSSVGTQASADMNRPSSCPPPPEYNKAILERLATARSSNRQAKAACRCGDTRHARTRSGGQGNRKGPRVGPSSAKGAGQSGTPDRPGVPTSRSLLARIRERDETAWRDFLTLYMPLVARWCLRKGLPEADLADVAQEGFRKVARPIEGYRKETPDGRLR